MEELYGPYVFEEPLSNFERGILATDPIRGVYARNIEHGLRELAQHDIELLERSERVTAEDLGVIINARDAAHSF